MTVMDSISPQTTLVELDVRVAAMARSQATAEGFSDLSEYVHQVILDRQRQRALEPLETMLLEGIESPDVVADDRFWSELNDEVAAAIRQANSP
jgi:hypothetical protein